jgi:hypothetical protein
MLDQQIERWKTANESLMTQTCTIERYTAALDGSNNYSEGWATIATGVPCRVMTREGRDQRAPTISVTDTYETLLDLKLHWDQAVSMGDRITIDSVEYIVIGIEDHQDPHLTERTVLISLTTEVGDAL